jgi:hypothetical protein
LESLGTRIIKISDTIYIYRRVRPTKNEPQQQGISYPERKKGDEERERGRRVGQQADIFEIRLGLREIER